MRFRRDHRGTQAIASANYSIPRTENPAVLVSQLIVGNPWAKMSHRQIVFVVLFLNRERPSARSCHPNSAAVRSHPLMGGAIYARQIFADRRSAISRKHNLSLHCMRSLFPDASRSFTTVGTRVATSITPPESSIFDKRQLREGELCDKSHIGN